MSAIHKIQSFFILFDNRVTSEINIFLKNYEIYTVPLTFVNTIPTFIKLTFYLFLFLIPVVILKLIYPFKESFHIILLFNLFLLTMSIFGIFIGFVQILYS